ncbi:MAG TPA: PIN domain-containing protein [Thermoleophilaceae bacterium]
MGRAPSAARHPGPTGPRPLGRRSASLYRTARGHGVTVRKTLDCLIAAPCVRTGAPLLHADADFDRLASCTPLRIYA